MLIFYFFFFNDTATTEIYTLSLHDALPISSESSGQTEPFHFAPTGPHHDEAQSPRQHLSAHGKPSYQDRKSTRLNSSHSQISYAVFCLKKKKSGNDDLIARPKHMTHNFKHK